jgi:mRNA interferase HicA
VKRRALVRHLEQNGCRLLREGAHHSIFVSPTGRSSTVPRHTEINEDLAKKICKDLGISQP